MKLVNRILGTIVILSFVLPLLGGTCDAAQPFTLKWSKSTGCTFVSGLGPLSVDVNKDGYYEVFVTGDSSPIDKMYCFDGRTGAVRWSRNLLFSITPHCPMEIYDLNKDGKYEVIQPGPNGMQVFRADTGALFWQNAAVKGSEAFQLVMDSDRNGYPYIYACNAATDGTARLRKVNGRTGQILIERQIWHPCHGGLSGADVDHNGRYELFLSDRETGGGKGIQCYDAHTLALKWYHKEIACSSFPPVIVDVNKDGVLDVVVAQRRDMNAGIYCLDGRTGNKISGKCQDSIPGLGVHEAYPVYDIDRDGRLELATCCASSIKVFDLGRWQYDTTLCVSEKAPYFANVIGDSKLDIVVSDGISSIKVYDSSYRLVSTISGTSLGSTVQDIDKDGLNELLVYGSNGVLRVYDTTASALSPRPRTNTHHFSEYNMRAGVYVSPP